MMFEFTEVERSNFEDLLYELRHAGYVTEAFYSRQGAEVKASLTNSEGGSTAVQVDFGRYGRKLMVRGRVMTPSGEELEFIRLAPMMTYIKSSVRKQR